MTLLNVLITSSAVALSVLINSASPANALVAQGGHLNARTPNHNGVMKRKRSSHKNRKRCVQQQPLAASSSSAAGDSVASVPSSTDQSAPANTPAPAPPTNYGSNPAQTCGNGAKVGLAWGPSMPSDYILHAITASTCWYYNWSAWAADSSVTGSLKFVPMLWGADKVSDFSDQVINTGTNYGIALAMNEVNQDGQADIPVGQGVQLWNQYLVPLKSRGYTIISPSTTSAPSGIQWMQGWLSGGLNAQPDALAFHWYGTSFDDFHNYVESYAAAFPGFPLWLTEFACTNFADGGCDTQAFANQAVNYLDNNPRIQAYFPFAFDGTMSNVGEASRLMTTDGVVTPLGWTYIR